MTGQRDQDRRVLQLTMLLIWDLLIGVISTGFTLTMYVVTGGHHPGWLQATSWVKWGMLAAGLTLIVLIARAARPQPPAT